MKTSLQMWGGAAALLATLAARGAEPPRAAKPPSGGPRTAVAAGPWTAELQAGGGYWGGDATYRIGREYRLPDGSASPLPFPLSELTFPLNVAQFTLEARAAWNDRLEARAGYTRNAGSPSDPIKDSDWEDDAAPDLVTTYSESDGDLTAWSGEAELLGWVLRSRPADVEWAAGLGAGYLHQDLTWDVSNVDQWYPQNPEWGHDYIAGQGASYRVKTRMPYGEAVARIRWHRMSLQAGVAYTPWLQVEDEDDHQLREIKADGDLDGNGWRLTASWRWELRWNLFLAARYEWFRVEADGPSRNTIYGGDGAGESWEIDEEYESSQSLTTLALGYRF